MSVLAKDGSTASFYRSRVDRIDWPALFQQMGNQQTMLGFNNTSHLLFLAGADQVFQEPIQLAQSFWAMSHASRTGLMPLLVNGEAHHDDHRPSRCRKTTSSFSFSQAT